MVVYKQSEPVHTKATDCRNKKLTDIFNTVAREQQQRTGPGAEGGVLGARILSQVLDQRARRAVRELEKLRGISRDRGRAYAIDKVVHNVHQFVVLAVVCAEVGLLAVHQRSDALRNLARS